MYQLLSTNCHGDLVRTHPSWESWDFVKFVEALKQWVKRNPAASSSDVKEPERARRNLFNMRSEDAAKDKGCIYCGDIGHKVSQGSKVIDRGECKKILARKGLCFNCAMGSHRASYFFLYVYSC